jgi:hypothetical protein
MGERAELVAPDPAVVVAADDHRVPLAEELTRAVDRAEPVDEIARAEHAVDPRERVERAGEELVLRVNVTDEPKSQRFLFYPIGKNVADEGSIPHLTTYHSMSDLTASLLPPLLRRNA